MLKSSMQTNLSNLMEEQEKLSSGIRLSKISDDPIDATQTNRMESMLEIQNQYLSNIKEASSISDLTDSTLTSIYDLILEVQSDAASSNVGTATADERSASATLVDAALSELVTLGNTEYLDSYLFGGTKNTTTPFTWSGNCVKFNGNFDSMSLQTSSNNSATLAASASDIFGTGSGEVEGYADLSPSATSSTLLSDLNGALGSGIRKGTFTITGSTIGAYTIDISQCSTLGDVVETVNNALPDTVNLSLDPSGTKFVLNSTTAGELLTVTETGTGMVAHDLGLYTATPTADTITGSDLGTQITLSTPIGQLYNGTGIDLTSGIVLTNGQSSKTLDFSSAKTVEDILTIINSSDMNVTAEINEDGTGINIINQLAGSDLTIGENGGTTAENLGIRTMRGETSLSELNGGAGVTDADGADFIITASDGSSVEVDIAGAKTVNDVINCINTQAAAAGINITAGLATQGNGIVLTDNTGGTNNFKVERAESLSNTAEELGILNTDGVAAGSQIVGSDVNPISENSIFSYLADLSTALKANDTQGIQTAAAAIENYMDRLNVCRGQVGYQAKSLELQKTRMTDAITTTKTLISNLKDVDYVDSITQYKTLETTLSASLQTGSKILETSLLDYLT
jgi:flagellin-like hook-associated protein FlgL